MTMSFHAELLWLKNCLGNVTFTYARCAYSLFYSLSSFVTPVLFCLPEERKPSIQEIATQKGIVQRANGWRIQHIAGQMDELVSEKYGLIGLFPLRFLPLLFSY